jgi:hypothetical protein
LAYKIEEENGRTLIGIEDLQGRVATERCVGDEWELHNELGTNVPEANGFIFLQMHLSSYLLTQCMASFISWLA